MRNRYLSIFLISSVLIFLSSGLFAQDLQDINEQIKELEKKIQRAADVEAIKNLMSLMSHVFGLDAGVKKTPGQCFGQGDGYMYGAFIRRSEMGKNPQMKESEEGDSGGAPKGLVTLDMLDFHMLTTSVIEIAEDGQTAKAVWYTPGMVGNTFMYENYACDFVKEDGEWKSWHRTVYADFATPSNKSWTEVNRGVGIGGGTRGAGGDIPGDSRSGGAQGGAPSGTTGPKPLEGSQAVMTGKDLKMVAYEAWSPTTLPQYKPKPPVPYKTFSETFSYCPPMPEDIEEMLWREDLMF